MPFPPDYHMHTPLCLHASGSPADYARHAASLGLAEIGFSDHAPMRQDHFDNWRMNRSDLDTYIQLVHAARLAQPSLHIRLALEVDWLPGQEPWIRELASSHPWDYLIGSVHYNGSDWAIDDPATLPRWQQANPDTVWSQYVDLLCQAAESQLFDILGHIDLPKKFGFRPSLDVVPLYDRFLQTAARCNVAIEINTAGLRKDCREMYPSLPILQRAAHHRVPLTFGSDAHAPSEVGANLADAVALARTAGFTHSRHFHQRQATDLPLP